MIELKYRRNCRWVNLEAYTETLIKPFCRRRFSRNCEIIRAHQVMTCVKIEKRHYSVSKINWNTGVEFHLGYLVVEVDYFVRHSQTGAYKG